MTIYFLQLCEEDGVTFKLSVHTAGNRQVQNGHLLQSYNSGINTKIKIIQCHERIKRHQMSCAYTPHVAEGVIWPAESNQQFEKLYLLLLKGPVTLN